MSDTHKPRSEWKRVKGRIVECIRKGCQEKPFSDGLCLKHYDKEKGNAERYGREDEI